MKHQDYPALFLDADNASNQYQSRYLLLVRMEYLALFVAAVCSMSFFSGVVFNLIYSAIFVVGLIVLITRALSKPEQSWYRCRALAESVKTLTWRYMMHAAPFQGSDAQARIELRNQLHLIFNVNLETARQITDDWSGNDQITATMETVRTYALADRWAYYLKHRVEEQRNWYRQKSRDNRKAGANWVYVGAACYVIAGAMVLSRIALPNWEYWPIEPLIVLAASIVGWMQIKKFNELAAAYTVTAHEIGLIQPLRDEVLSDAEFSEFVNDSEKAFSREHTLWLARQSD